MIVVVLLHLLSVFLNVISDTSELLLQTYHAQVRTVKISLTFIECQNFAGQNLGCNICTALNTCTDCADGFIKYNTNLCIKNDATAITTTALANMACSKFDGTSAFGADTYTYYLGDADNTGATATGVAYTAGVTS